MSGPKYSADELRFLRGSNLVKRPPGLPSIDQWIEPAAAEARKQSRRYDENDNPSQRHSLFDARPQSGARKDVFLGPKSSFAASASAARQANRHGPEDDPKARHDRVGNRDRFHDGPAGDDNRSVFRSRRDSNEKERPPHLRQRSGLGGVELDENDSGTWRRNGAARAKLDQPWFRDGKDKPAEEPRGDKRTSWRDREQQRRLHNHDESFGGGLGSGLGGFGEELEDAGPSNPTQHDLAAFLKSMKQKDTGAPDHAPEDDLDTFPEEPAQEPSQPSQPSQPAAAAKSPPVSVPQNENLFGFFGDMGMPEKPAEPAKKPGVPKKSRFFGGGGDTQPPKQPEQARPPVEAEQPSDPPTSVPGVTPKPNASTADQEGFERMMQMLRMGGSASQSHSASAFAPPPGQPHHHVSPSAPPNVASAVAPEPGPRREPERREAPSPPQPQARPGMPQPGPRQEGVSRDSEFLLNLMKSRSPLAEHQIYGQNYHRPVHSEDAQMAKKPVGPPPGFTGHDRPFYKGPEPPMGPDPRHGGPPLTKADDMHHMHGRPPGMDERFPMQHSGHPVDLGPQGNFFHGGPPRDAMPPPPGFPSARGNPPPGFFGPPPPQNGPPMPQHMRGPPPPPMPFNGPPPGFGMPPPGLQNMPGNGRRPPSGQLPPGFDMYQDGMRRQQGPPPPPNFPQYVKQGGFQGM